VCEGPTTPKHYNHGIVEDVGEIRRQHAAEARDAEGVAKRIAVEALDVAERDAIEHGELFSR
jgi:hypothetical protein